MVELSEEEGRTLIKTDGFVCLIPGGKCVYTDYTLNHVVIITSPAGERDMENDFIENFINNTDLMQISSVSNGLTLQKHT